jgi:hypothetical protein
MSSDSGNESFEVIHHEKSTLMGCWRVTVLDAGDDTAERNRCMPAAPEDVRTGKQS